MRDNVVFVDFTKNKRRNKKEPLLSRLKIFFRRMFNSTDPPSHTNNTKKIIDYNKDIS